MADFLDEKLIKRPADDRPLTKWEGDEWVKCALDKKYFFENYVYLQGEHGKTLFKPRSYQQRVIEESINNRFTISLLGRQSGKCCGKDTKLVVRCKKTGEMHELTSEEFHTLVKNKANS